MKQLTTSPDERKVARKNIRKAANHVALGILVYVLVMGLVTIIGTFFLPEAQLSAILHAEDLDAATNMLMDLPSMGIIQIVSMVIGLLAVFLCFVKKGTHKELFRKGKPMTLKTFGILFCVFFMFDFIGTCCYELIELDLNAFGLSTALGLEMASGSQSTWLMFLAVGIIAPIVEELVCRGFLLRRMEKHGKILAIVLSSVLFGLMHENLPQIPGATAVGLVLGYVTLEYSIWWAMALHAINNLVVCDLLSRLLKNSGQLVQFLAYRGLYAFSIVVALVALYRNRKSVIAWIRNNRSQKSAVVWTFTAVIVLVAVAIFTFSTIQFISVM